MGDVHVDHQQVVITHFGQASALRGAAVNGDAFADAVAIAHFNTRRFARVFQILIHFTDGGELINLIIAADLGNAVHHHVGFQHRAGADFHLGADVAERGRYARWRRSRRLLRLSR